MSTIRGVDMSSRCDATAAACLQKAGIAFVGRYYTSLPDDPKLLTAAEAQAICGAGLQLVAVFENGGNEFSAALGTANAQAALRHAAAVGQPAGSAIYFAVDYDAAEDDVTGNITPYFQAVSSAIGRQYAVGVYGSGLVCTAILGAGLASFSWLSMSMGWTGSSAFDQWSIKQGLTETLCGLSVDTDLANPPFGAFTVTA